MKKKKGIVRNLLDYIIIILIVIVLRTFIITPAVVRQQSMEPTLFEKDIMLLNKIGVRFGNINRFDVVVIDLGNEYIIKRVIGLPGEYIEYTDNKLYVNGIRVEEIFLEDDVITSDFKLEDIDETIIGDNMYFVLGDNRINSTDSRIIGLINIKDIVGKTNIILYPFKHMKIID